MNSFIGFVLTLIGVILIVVFAKQNENSFTILGRSLSAIALIISFFISMLGVHFLDPTFFNHYFFA